MSVLQSIPQQSYAAGARTFTPWLGAGNTEIQISFSRVSWPAGPCMRLTYWYPNGDLAGSASFDGGSGLDRQGRALSHCGLRAREGFLPAGQYAVQVEFLQPITTAVTIQDA